MIKKQQSGALFECLGCANTVPELQSTPCHVWKVVATALFNMQHAIVHSIEPCLGGLCLLLSASEHWLVCRRLGTAAQALLQGYVEAHGRQLTIAVRRSVDSTNWLQVLVAFPRQT